MTTSAVIVTYNRLEMLKEVIAALQASQTPVDHLIVVDNHSNEDTVTYLTSLGNQIEYVRLSENLGGAGGFNRGVRYFMEKTNDDYVWLMDDDTVPHQTTLTELTNFAQTQPDFGFLASDVRWTDGHRAKMNNPAPKNRMQKIPEDATEPEELMNATFVSLLMRREIVAQIGLPITEFFIWGDDIEYTERAARLAPGYFIPAAKVTHKMATNVGSSIMTDSLDRLPRYFYSYRNKVYYGAKRNLKGHVKSNVRIALEAVKLMLQPGITDRKKRVNVLFSGVKAGWTFKPVIEFANK
ncbi:MAG: glycosyltransferase family 2 protein [Lactobacillaceae bacterium]|jgi:GT2 family glycosyltransferase|nr:glycosyltransferase family 2 protein [Lactobacillaceae bacterium]